MSPSNDSFSAEPVLPLPQRPQVGLPPGYEMYALPPAPLLVIPNWTTEAVPVAQLAAAPEIKQDLPKPKQSVLRRFRDFWRQIGGSSLTFSVSLHVGLILLAGWVVLTTTQTSKNVDFLPAGGTSQGQSASENLAVKIKQKRSQVLKKDTPLQRVVSHHPTDGIVLPDVPLETLNVPESNAWLGASMAGRGSFASIGMGNGAGAGLSLGNTRGFVGMTLFGKIGGDGLPGIFYDLKQTPERQATAFAGEINEAEYARIINQTAAKHFSSKATADFFHSTQKMSFTYLLVPYMAATEGPKSFKVENEVQPRGWFVHYGGQIQAPAPGDYRFVGMFDDALIVYINGKPVLDGSWYSIVDHGERRRDESIRQDFGGPVVPGTGNRHAYAGKWVKLDGSTRIDIVVGERPGGRVGGLLLVQAKKGKYQTREDGTPILPVFSTVKMESADISRLREFSGMNGTFEIAAETPVFTLRKPLFGE